MWCIHATPDTGSSGFYLVGVPYASSKAQAARAAAAWHCAALLQYGASARYRVEAFRHFGSARSSRAASMVFYRYMGLWDRPLSNVGLTGTRLGSTEPLLVVLVQLGTGISCWVILTILYRIPVYVHACMATASSAGPSQFGPQTVPNPITCVTVGMLGPRIVKGTTRSSCCRVQ